MIYWTANRSNWTTENKTVFLPVLLLPVLLYKTAVVLLFGIISLLHDHFAIDQSRLWHVDCTTLFFTINSTLIQTTHPCRLPVLVLAVDKLCCGGTYSPLVSMLAYILYICIVRAHTQVISGYGLSLSDSLILLKSIWY